MFDKPTIIKKEKNVMSLKIYGLMYYYHFYFT